ncbi:MAG: Gfo/Idh/MocA family oxidoreductase [Candidatus Omnitrophota bacterium]
MAKVAVIGSGYWGKNLVRNFYSLKALSAICDTNADTLKSFREKYPDVYVTDDYPEILERKDIDGIVIATPAAFHFELAREAFLAGKHVFAEKPLSLNTRDAEELISLAEKNRKTLMVGHILQYHSGVLKLKELIDAGELGKIEYIYSNRLNMGKIRTEENILWSFAPHDISVILMLLNEYPETIYTTGGAYLQHNIADVTLTTMSFPDGVKAHIFVSWLHPFKEQKLVVVGDKKMAVFDDMTDEKLFLYPHKVEWIDRVPVASKAEVEAVPFKMEEPLRSECAHFLECVDGKTSPRTDGHEGLRVLKILQASQESLEKGGQVISPGKKAPREKYSVHGSSYVDEGVEIGEGTQIWHFSHVLKGSKIGKDCRIGQNVVIGPDAVVGDNCKIQNNVSVYKGVVLEDNVFCGPSMVFTNVLNPRSGVPRMHEAKDTIVRKGATIGANATIVCGNTIGEYAFIGAGAVVTKDVPAYALMKGNPARHSGWMCECGVRIKFEGTNGICPSCSSRYVEKNGKVTRK